MLTTPHLPLTVHTRSDAASDRGPRAINADAVATHTDPDTGRMAFVVADGVGDHLLAARAARLAASVAAEQAVHHGAAEGLLAAQRELLAQFDQPQADAVLVVAVLPAPGGEEETGDIAWVGDCRAYRWNGRVLHQVTVDHTMAEFWRAHGMTPSPRMEHMVTDSVRTAKPGDVGRARISAGAGRLVLASDGVHKSLGLPAIRTLLADGVPAGDTAAALVAAARERGSGDNATAVVVDRVLA
ncbi:PP2C family protein-serine/threonine phosphatase [Prauserella muralis]|uniref:Serine/threonine protein phosphatase n=1 Tax=Prauserella muralis TaxID=588067 RepID=A0A2V4AL87_9PSEU|nr:protein phosphatase 2C domain-containing protein [Prauserella muralis]PXY21012.1 serine/threonine protein phosphatase [Prauserella muralis]TWE30083.1 protein phosphatase [Prauserella muralis]